MVNVISFSIWGDNPKYVQGAIENIQAAQEIYPGWECVFFVQNSVPVEDIVLISSMGGKIVHCPIHKSPWEGLFHRFLIVDTLGVETCIIRDSDSILTVREKVAVDDWLNSSKMPFHIMRDHPQHCVPILGGMWGFTRRDDISFPFNMRGVVSSIVKEKEVRKGDDQIFLATTVWPLFYFNHITHQDHLYWEGDSILTRPFPKHDPLPNGLSFVGEIIER